jgi:hypothetical protein
LQQSLAIYKQSKNCPSNIIDILYHFENNGIDFIRKGAGGSQPKTSGFEDEFFIDICHFIQDLKN